MNIRFLTRILAGERYGGLCVYVCVYVLQHTLSAMDQSVALKIWLALLLNSAILPVLVESRFDSVPDALGGLFFKGAFRDFVPEWYNKVGATLMQSMLIMAATATLMPFVSAFLASVGRFSARRNAVTQLELDEAYIGQKLELSTEVGEMLNLMSVVMLFAAGMPLLYMIGSVYCFFKYWATKYAAMRVYYVLQSDDRLILSAAEILPFNGAVHLAFAIWMLSYVDAGAEADSITSTASQVNLSVRLAHPIFVILTVLLLVYGAYLVVYNFLFRLFEACKNTCSKSSDAEQDEIGNHPSFAEVIRETHAGGQDDEHKVTRLKGFKSYEITVAPDNPCVRNARISCASTTATLCSMLACVRCRRMCVTRSSSSSSNRPGQCRSRASRRLSPVRRRHNAGSKVSASRSQRFTAHRSKSQARRTTSKCERSNPESRRARRTPRRRRPWMSSLSSTPNRMAQSLPSRPLWAGRRRRPDNSKKAAMSAVHGSPCPARTQGSKRTLNRRAAIPNTRPVHCLAGATASSAATLTALMQTTRSAS